MIEQPFFRSSGYQAHSKIQTDSGNTLDLLSLPPFLRTLLVMDGTVTKALESWFWEPVNVSPQKNSQADNSQILEREVLLSGHKTSRIFACARSSVSLEKLPKTIATALLKSEIGIGGLLREKGLETYRELFNINYFKALPHDDTLLEKLVLESSNRDPESSSEVISRSYRIWVNGKPAIIVTEYFPVSIYEN